MIAGRKLLVADDSVAYRKVIDLTFTDEGMDVTTVTDGQEAWESLEQSVPDIVLADVIMPGSISGYELCRLIKQNERFRRIPVMLLVGLYEPFDEAEARRVGADDFVTKPFQSIRQLVSRVGSLLTGKAGDEEASAHEHSTLGITHPEVAPDEHPMPETNVTVLVEAPSMPETTSTYPEEAAGSTCAADIELQTADTMSLEPIDHVRPARVVEQMAYAHDDTIEMEPAIQPEMRKDSSTDVRSNGQKSATVVPEMSEQSSQQIAPTPAAIFEDSILDLGDFGSTRHRAIAEDVILDLDYEESAAASVTPSEAVPEVAAVPAQIIVGGHALEAQPVPVVELQEWSIVTEPPAPVDLVTPVHVADESQMAGDANLSLSPETIDAIARRTVEHLSERVVREIAWEVVPELAELLIKKKLEEQK